MSSSTVAESQRMGHLSARTQIVVRFVDANLHRKLSMDELARSVMISRTQLWRLFKADLAGC
jgi:transcriptional regulator GlxA family with amidase domain